MAARKSTKVERVCPVCQITFRVTPYEVRRGRGLACSVACRTLRRREQEGPISERFWAEVKKTDGCWLWTASTVPDGYGKISHNGRRLLAHRLSWEIHFGPIPAGLLVLHHCDNPPCVRPDHLFLGTNQDNVADKMMKGRGNPPCGERARTAILTETKVREIRRRIVAGIPRAQLALEHGVSKTAIDNIATRKTWHHLA